MMELITSPGKFTGLEKSNSHNILSPWSDCEKPAYLHVFQNMNPNVTAFMPGACSSKVLISLKKKPLVLEPLFLEGRARPDVSIQHTSKSLLSEGMTKPKQFSWNCSTPWISDFTCAGPHMASFYRGKCCKDVGCHLKEQVESKTQSTLKLLNRNVHFPAISAVSENCLGLEK